MDRTWLYLDQACQWAVRQGMTKTNPAAEMLLPAARPAKARKSLTIEQAERLLVDAIPADYRPEMWLTGQMCGLRPGELAGLRWPYVDLDSPAPSIEVAERALEIEGRYAGQAELAAAAHREGDSLAVLGSPEDPRRPPGHVHRHRAGAHVLDRHRLGRRRRADGDRPEVEACRRGRNWAGVATASRVRFVEAPSGATGPTAPQAGAAGSAAVSASP